MSLSRLEIAVFLRTVELFRHCTTAQLIRIAEIARQEKVNVEAVIYRINQPADAMYCIIEGEVEMSSADGSCWLAKRRGTFGLTEILTDELRASGAKSESSCQLLVVDAEDLLDLLSNNIEIVRSLFKQLLKERKECPSNGEHQGRMPA